MLEVPIVVELCLIHPNSREMRREYSAQSFEGRIIREPSFLSLAVDVGNRLQQQPLIRSQDEASFDCGESQHLLLSPAIRFYFTAVICSAVRQFGLCKLILAVEEFGGRKF